MRQPCAVVMNARVGGNFGVWSAVKKVAGEDEENVKIERHTLVEGGKTLAKQGWI